MKVPLSYLVHQRPMLGALGKLALGSLLPHTALPDLPTLPTQHSIALLPPRLVDDFIRFSGGEPASYRDVLPPALFAQWSLPLAAQQMARLGLPVQRMLNAGCTLQINEALPRDTPLFASSRILKVDENERRLVIEHEVCTGTAMQPNMLLATVQGIIKKTIKKSPEQSAKNGRPDSGQGDAGAAGNNGGGTVAIRGSEHLVPYDARALVSRDFGLDAGRAFALLTGDVNPIHWLGPYARASGFARPILHGFATMAFALEAVNQMVLHGDIRRLHRVSMRFTNPLVLPTRATVYLRDANFALTVGRAKGAPAAAIGEVMWDHS